MSETADHCLELVRAGDKDRFLASLFAPDDKRRALFALYAFSLEIARVRGQMSEPQLGEIRYQWWRETIEALYRSEASPHPVAQELARAVEAGRLPMAPFLNLIAARAYDLYDGPLPDLAHLEGYLGETSSALIQMASLILAGADAAKSAEAAGLAGVAYGLARLDPRLLPKNLDVGAHATRRLAEARALRHTVSPAALPAFLPASLTGLYLARPAPSQLRRQFTLWRMAKRGEF